MVCSKTRPQTGLYLRRKTLTSLKLIRVRHGTVIGPIKSLQPAVRYVLAPSVVVAEQTIRAWARQEVGGAHQFRILEAFIVGDPTKNTLFVGGI